MKPALEVKWISKDRLNVIAEKFLEKHHPSLSIPVPIEKIIDVDLGIDIIPVPGLKQSYRDAGLDIDAFISSDLKSITVDEYVYQIIENRYRFTLAHELSHKILHMDTDIYQKYIFNNIDEWLATLKEIQAVPAYRQARDWAEWQADELAGRILVPKAILADEFYRERDETFQNYSEDHPQFVLYSDQVDYLDFVTDVTVHSLAQKFVVSDKTTMKIRLERDGLIEKQR